MQRLIRTHKKRLEKFGDIDVEEIEVKGRTGSTKKKLYYLNEQQSYLFITFLKNTEDVLDFKELLIKEFFEMKKALNDKKISNQHNSYIYQLERENTELRRAINRLSLKPTYNEELKKLQDDNKDLKRTLIDFSNRYHSIVLEAEDKVKAIKSELTKMTNCFQQLPNLANDGKNLNTDTMAKHSHW